MSQTQARRNRIARTAGEHCHDYPQLMLGWRGAMDYEFSRGSERLALGQAAILPEGETHRYLGRGDDSEVLVIDLDRHDPCLASLEQSCTLSLRESLFAEPRALSLPPNLMPMVDYATGQLHGARTPQQAALISHQLALLFVSQFSLLLGEAAPEVPRHDRLPAAALDAFIDERLEHPPDNRALAEAMHLGQSQLHLLCQRRFGVTPQQYVLQRRLQWARHWLNQTARPIDRP